MLPRNKTPFLILIIGLVSLLMPDMGPATERGLVVRLRNSNRADAPVTGEVELYRKSYALVIGIDHYTHGWPILSNAIHDAKRVAKELKKRHFNVTFKEDLNSRDLKQAFEQFFVFKGEAPQARLFVWFAGHGHTLDGEGFLVPSDAPKPDQGAQFRYKALSLRRFGEYVRLAKAKHALSVFDSCFSGTIFATQRSLPPAAITRATTFPVRQFISSGDADQTVSDDGRFCKLFIRALEGAEDADANQDGYLTGSELGMFITDRVTNLTQARQTPRYGKLLDMNYDRGDFVFRLPSADWIYKKAVKVVKTMLSIEANVSGAQVMIDGKPVGETNLSGLEITPGRHRIRVAQAGYAAYVKHRSFKKGMNHSMMVMLRPLPQKVPQARLYVNTDPDTAQVRILNIREKFFQGIPLKAGRYHLEVTDSDYETDTRWVEIQKGEDKTIELELTRKQVEPPPEPEPEPEPEPKQKERTVLPPISF